MLRVQAAKGDGAYCAGGLLLLDIGGPPHGLDAFGAARRAGVWGMARLVVVTPLMWERRKRLRAGTGAATGVACAVYLEELLRSKLCSPASIFSLW